MRRREFIAFVAAAASWPKGAYAQAPKKGIIAWLSPGAEKGSMIYAGHFLEGMRDLGYTDGRDFEMLYRFSDGYQDRLPRLTEEIIQRHPDVIVATAVVAAATAKRATSTIPIVCPALADAVHLGLVASEARPGGNITGVEPYVAGLPAKQMQFVRELMPGAAMVGVLNDLRDPKTPPQVKELEDAARAIGVTTVVAGADGPDDLERALQALVSNRVAIVVVLQSSTLLVRSGQIAASALAKGLPTICGYREHVLAGSLMSYGIDLRWCFHRGAYFVDKILRGTPAGELPVEFPTKLLLSLNLKTAAALKVTVPPLLIAQADEVIE